MTEHVKLWDLIYTIPYNSYYGKVDPDGVILELQDSDPFVLNSTQEERLTDLIEDLYQVIDDEMSGWEEEGISFDNGQYETDYIITKYKLNGDIPIISYDRMTGKVTELNCSMTSYELK